MLVVQYYLVQSKEHKHSVGTDELGSIDEWVILHQPKGQPSGFLLERWVSICLVKTLEWSENAD